MIVNSVSTPWMPYQKKSGWCGSSEQGLTASQPRISPIFGIARTACVAGANRSEELEKQGTLVLLGQPEDLASRRPASRPSACR